MSATASLRRRELLLEDLTGLAAVNAIDRLRELELRPAVEGCETGDADQHGLVVAQEPSADSPVRRAQLITLVVGQHPDNQPVSRHRQLRPSPLPSPGGRNGNRADPETNLKAASQLAATEPMVDDGEDRQQLPSLSPGEGSSTASPTEADPPAGSLDIDALHPPAGVAHGTERPEHGREGRTRLEHSWPTRRRAVRAAGALVLIAAGSLVAIIGAVAGLHEARYPRPDGLVTPPRPTAVTKRPTQPTRASQARKHVARHRPARRRNSPPRHPRQLTAADARPPEPHPVARGFHAAPSNSALPAVASPAPAHPETRSPAAVRSSSRAPALPPSPTGSLPGPPPT